MSSKSKVESYGTLPWNVLQLAEHLRQERLFVSAEQQNLQNLNEKVLFDDICWMLFCSHI